MAIIAAQTMDSNWATGNYHKILKIEFICSDNVDAPHYRIIIGFYASEAARAANKDMLHQRTVNVLCSDTVPDLRIFGYEQLMLSDGFANTNAVSDEN